MSEDIRNAASAAAVTPSNTVNLAYGCRSLFIGGAGDVAVVFPGMSGAVVFAGCAAGSILPVQAQRVNLTGTTATNIVALF